MERDGTRTVARLLVECLEHEGVEYVFGLPGEENLHVIDALAASSIRFVTTRDERGAAFMADAYGAFTGRPGVCLATLGPGAINLMLGIANAQLDSHPLVAITAQAGLHRIYKESHQVVDLVALFRPITKWGDMVTVPRGGAGDGAQGVQAGAGPNAGRDVPRPARGRGRAGDRGRAAARERAGRPGAVRGAGRIGRRDVLERGAAPVVLAGPGVARDGAMDALHAVLGAPQPARSATTFLGKGVFPDDHPNALGTIGFMVSDYANFGFDRADVVVAVGYDLVEYSPSRWNPGRDKQIVHIHRTVAEVDEALHAGGRRPGDIGEALDAIADRPRSTTSSGRVPPGHATSCARSWSRGADDDAFPLASAADRARHPEALGREDIVLCDTGAVKMWMARLYPTYEPNTCLISNGLATMAFALPGAFAAKLVHPERKVLAVMGDGAFLMSVARDRDRGPREGVHFVMLVWVDGGYGLIGWKQDIHFGRRSAVSFGNPDFVQLRRELRREGLPDRRGRRSCCPRSGRRSTTTAVSIIACPVDYAENARLVERLGALSGSI